MMGDWAQRETVQNFEAYKAAYEKVRDYKPKFKVLQVFSRCPPPISQRRVDADHARTTKHAAAANLLPRERRGLRSKAVV